MLNNFIAIDFETANRFSGSICSVGIAIYNDNCLVDSEYWLVKPHEDYSDFEYFNTKLHGIDYDAVKDALEFDAVYDQILPYLPNKILVAHNASFDMSALRNVLSLYNIPYPEIEYVCTYKIAAKVWDSLENHKLDTLCNHLGHNFEHHNALQDAIACGSILTSALEKTGLKTINELISIIGMRAGKLHKDCYEACSTAINNSKALRTRFT